MHIVFAYASILSLCLYSAYASPPYFGWRPNFSGWKPTRADPSAAGSWITSSIGNRNAAMRERGQSPFGGSQLYYVIPPQPDVSQSAEDGSSEEDVPAVHGAVDLVVGPPILVEEVDDSSEPGEDSK